MTGASASGGESQLDLILDGLAGQGPPARPIWLPPLGEPSTLDQLLPPLQRTPERGLSTADAHLYAGLLAVAGIVDRPELQRRDTLRVDLSGGNGHLAIVGRPKSGKSTLAAAIVGSLALTHTPEEAQFYCLDFGGGVLQALDELPHVGSVASRRQPELVHRTVAELVTLMKTRQELAETARSETGAMPDDGPGGVFLVIDNWRALGNLDEGLQDAVLDLAAPPGPFRGVRLILTADGWSDIRLRVRELFRNRLELSLLDPSSSEIDRRAAARVPSGRPGRGIVSGGSQFLSALPRIDGDPSPDGLLDGIRAMARRVKEAWDGPVAPPVRVLPNLLPFDALPTEPERGIPIGIEEQTLSPVVLDFARDPHFVALGDGQCGKSNLLQMVLHGIKTRYTAENSRIIIVDCRRSLLDSGDSEHVVAYAASPSAAAGLMADVHGALTARLPPERLTPEQLRARSWWSGPELFLVVDDYDLVATPSGNSLAQLAEFLPQARDIGFHLILTRSVAGASRAMFDPVLSRLKEMACPALIMSGPKDEGGLFGLRPRRLPPGRGQLVDRSTGSLLVQTALFDPGVSGPAPASPDSPE